MDRQIPSSLLMFISYRAAEDRIFAAVAEAGYGDVTRAQARLLAGIDPGGTRLVVLAQRARIAKQTALSLVNALESAGYDPDAWLDRAINATRTEVFPLHGLDPDDPALRRELRRLSAGRCLR